VFAVTRLRVAESEAADLAAAVSALLTVLAARPGFVDGEVGRSTEDGGLWALLTRWDGVGSYRRALSAAEVKIAGAPVWVHALDEPSVYVDADDGPPGVP
jgi:Antibiotic biosynthesis monooxygenase